MTVEELLKDRKFTEKLDSLGENVDDVVRLFAEYGVEADAEMIRAQLEKLESGELTENDLEDVAGGCAAFVIVTCTAIAVYLYYRYRQNQINNRR